MEMDVVYVVVGEENHPDRFMHEVVYGPYTEAEALAKAKALNEAPTNRRYNHTLYWWTIKELTV
jgi:hypothetical protein